MFLMTSWLQKSHGKYLIRSCCLSEWITLLVSLGLDLKSASLNHVYQNESLYLFHWVWTLNLLPLNHGFYRPSETVLTDSTKLFAALINLQRGNSSFCQTGISPCLNNIGLQRLLDITHSASLLISPRRAMHVFFHIR